MGSKSASVGGWRDGLLFSVAYTRSKLIDDASSVFDASILTGPVANFQIADSSTSPGSATTRPATSRTCSWPPSCGISRSGAAGPISCTDCRRHSHTTGPSRRRHAAVGRAGRGHADDQLQCLRRVRHAAAESGRAIRRCRRRSGDRITGSTPRRSRSRRSSRWDGVAKPGARAVVPERRSRASCGASVSLRHSASKLRAEIFNLLNTAQLGAPAAVAGAANFGTITTALDPRVVQVAVKIHF